MTTARLVIVVGLLISVSTSPFQCLECTLPRVGVNIVKSFGLDFTSAKIDHYVTIKYSQSVIVATIRMRAFGVPSELVG